ncbi:MAG: outer membrane lipoprotein carrier protein LolA [Spirochaetaceae bacterium]|nr:outer membrane lipoprotein carrier protein LolA [Spirochaetaceae bacterium]
MILALLLFGGTIEASLQAQTNSVPLEIFRFPLTQESYPRFNELCSRLSSHPVIKGTFERTKTISSLNRSLLSKGAFIIAKNYGIVWETLDPFPSTLAMGKNYLVQSDPTGRKTRLDAAGNETFLRLADTISAVFSGDSQKLTANFQTFFAENAGTWTIGLVPRESSVRSFAATIAMSGDSVIRSIMIYEQNGDKIHYRLTNHTFPGALTAGEISLFAAQ